MIDLHIHTTHSDGTWDTKKILKEAEKANLDYISITDHNSVDAYFDIKDFDLSSIYNGKIITGCEFSCVFNGRRIEFLGYNIDIEKTKEWIKSNYNYEEYSMQMEYDKLIELCKKNNIKISDNLAFDETKEYPYDVIYNDIIKYEENMNIFTEEELASSDNFYRSAVSNKENPVHIDFNIDPTAKQLSDFIRSMGGKAFIAHAFVYKFNDTIQVLNELISQNIIDGIEVYHTTHEEEHVQILLNICKENNLLISAGSDCHGDRRSERKLGKIYNGKPISNELIYGILKNI